MEEEVQLNFPNTNMLTAVSATNSHVLVLCMFLCHDNITFLTCD